ncbi:single-stranded DNA-binding protein [Aeromicrobium wangtongii]|uniref:Single-stranded DNA-binding protein n=1 Tax=Aeromicrobium wangtongii TaxID=2969247 RepID=A0ABY5M6C5_9ACTN|nr:single-stranded DNA-binding protein [Aeromicrobium wangtongii]MCD9198682.1 single-stranded DNA-binding protein [Aeromicrobium wangtongii]MCL3818637.1 single-stranded DNA-binding protein [Aeromicrobium wangtongii]UUP12706.1 single-stranded DNA-binding protein [Aeromicrobium wangtongii]
MTDDRTIPDDNTVHLTGRISAAPERRTLPSGDEIVSFRLVVRRGRAARRRSKQVVDTIECTVWRAALRRSVLRLAPGTRVSVTGQLRRRFSRGSAAVASWVSVEVDSCRPDVAAAVASDP